MQRSNVDLPEPDGPEHADGLALADLETDVGQDLVVAKALGDAGHVQHRVARSSPCRSLTAGVGEPARRTLTPASTDQAKPPVEQPPP